MKSVIKSILYLLVLTPSVLTAQAWTKPKGHGFYKFDIALIKANQVLDTKGELVPFRTLGNYTTSFYGEYGLTDKITVLGYVPFYVRNVLSETKGIQTGQITDPAIVHNNFGDVDLGFRYQLPIKKVAMAASLMLGLPTGDAKQANSLFTGDGEFNQLLKIGVGSGGKRWWTQGALGFNNRTKGFSDEFRYDFEFGYKFFNDRLLAIFKINGIESFNNGSAKAASTGLFSNNVEYAAYGPELLYYANAKKNIGFSARLGRAVKGQNILAAPSWSVGAFAEF